MDQRPPGNTELDREKTCLKKEMTNHFLRVVKETTRISVPMVSPGVKYDMKET